MQNIIVAGEAETFGGKTVAFTGELKMGRRRAAERVRALGGIVKPRINKAVDYLVVGTAPGSRLEKAFVLGVPVVYEDRFLQMLGGDANDSVRTSYAADGTAG